MLIEQFREIDRDLNEAQRAEGFYFSPSRAGSCKRAMFLDALGEERDPLANNMRHIFEDGRAHEDLTVRWFEMRVRGVTITDRQKPVNIPLPIGMRLNKLISHCPLCNSDVPANHMHGHIDGIYNKTETGASGIQTVHRGLFEHKAINDDSFRKFTQSGVSLNYLTQAALYLKGLNLQKGSIFVKNKNNGTYLEAEVEYNRLNDTLKLVRQIHSNETVNTFNASYTGITKNAFEEFRKIEDNLAQGVVPPKESNKCHACWQKTKCDEIYLNIDRPNFRDVDQSQNPELHRVMDNKVKEFSELKDLISQAYQRLDVLKDEIMPVLNENGIKRFLVNNLELCFSTFTKEKEDINKELLREALGDQYENFVEKTVEVQDRLWVKKREPLPSQSARPAAGQTRRARA